MNWKGMDIIMKKVITNIFYISFLIYIFLLICVLFLMSRSYNSSLSLFDYIKRSSNIIPLKTIITYVEAIIKGDINMDIPVKNLLGNLVLFFPMGFYMTYSHRKPLSLKNYTLICILILICIEVGQILLRRGSFDIDDFILNISGAIIGFVFFNLDRVRCFIHNLITN